MTIQEKEEKFKNIIKSVIEQFGSLNKTAEAMGVDSAYLSRRLNPNSHNEFKTPPRPNTLRKIANVCNVDYVTLMWLCDYFSDDEYSIYIDNKYKKV